MLCVRCLAMGFHPSKARLDGQFLLVQPSGPRGPLHEASKIDPILETGAAGSARPGEAGLGCAAGASGDRWRAVIVRSGAVLEAPTLIAGLDDVAVVGETIEECGGHLWVAEHARPFAEGEIGGGDDRGGFVEGDDVEASGIVGDASLASGSPFGLELIDEIDGGEEAPA